MQCVAGPTKDAWYCLRNSTIQPKSIALSGHLVITNEPILPTTHRCIDQQPNQSNGLFSDLDCDACVDGGNPPQQVIAEQMLLPTAEQIDEVRFWGGYFPSDAGNGEPPPDSFTIRFRLNDDPTDDDWFWEAGTHHAVAGRSGSAFSFDPPVCPPITQESWCTYVVSEVLSDPVDCNPEGIVNGATICVTPCIVPGDIAVCDPDGTGTAKLQIIDDDCLFRVIPVDGCTTCPPGTPTWRRLN